MENNYSPRYAHCDGHTDLCYDSTGRYIITGGDDGEVRIWEGHDSDDVSFHVGNKVYSVAYCRDRIYVANDMNSVQAFTFEDHSPDGIVTRFTSPATHITINSLGTKLAAGSGDFKVKVVELEKVTSNTFEGHEAPILSVALDPKDEFLASSSCDGTVRVWKLSNQEVVKTLQVLPKSNSVSFSKTLCRLSWEPKTGQYLVIPVSCGIEIYSRQGWRKLQILTDDHIVQDVSILDFSPCGLYLAASCRDGAITVWDWVKKACILRTRHEEGLNITAMKWSPQGNHELSFCDSKGQMSGLKDAISSTRKAVDWTTENAESKDIFGDDEDFDEQESVDDISTIIGRQTKYNENDIDRISVVSDVDSRAAEFKSLNINRTQELTPLQSAFQPSSCPEKLSCRFMKWNNIGIVRQYDTEEENSIDVEFHDTSVHHAMHLTNTPGYCLADISTEAVLLASHCDEDSPSKFLCMHFSAWDNSKEWSVDLPEGENAIAVALGSKFCVVGTDKYQVRMFSLTGIQMHIFSVPGRIVCISSFSQYAIIVYHRAMGATGDQCLSFMLVRVSGKHIGVIVNNDPLPISFKSTLIWIGFSIQGTPFTQDSQGVIRLMSHNWANLWVPVCNTKDHTRGKSDNYWLVGVNENPQQIRCILCKGSRYPQVIPRPTVAVLPFKLPLCQPEVEKSQNEEVFLRTEIFNENINESEWDKPEKTVHQKLVAESLIKLFALSVKTDREQRALDICELMEESSTLQLAIKYATRLGHLQLAERISELAMSRTAQHEINEKEENDHPKLSFRCGDQITGSNGNINDPRDVDTDHDMLPSGQMTFCPTVASTNNHTVENHNFANSARSRLNPFKIQSQDKSNVAVKGSQVFDVMDREHLKSSRTSSVDSIPVPKKTKILKKPGSLKAFMQVKDLVTSNIPTATQSTDHLPDTNNELLKPGTAFELWFRSNEAQLQEDLSAEGDSFKEKAMATFQQLPRDEKQVWLQKSRSTKKLETIPDDNRKRKWDEFIDDTKSS